MNTFFIGIMVLLSLGTPVFAQDVVSNLEITEGAEKQIENKEEEDKTLPILPQKIDEIKNHFQERKIELGSKIEEKRREIQNRLEESKIKIKLEDRAKERVLGVINQIFHKSEAILVKFDGIVVRIEDRITELKDSEINTLEEEKKLDEARLKIENATILLVATQLEIQNALDTGITEEEIKTTIQGVKIGIKEAHTALTQVVEELKSLENSNTIIIQ